MIQRLNLFPNNKLMQFCLMIIFSCLVVLSSELKFYPFGNDLFRFGLGPVAFTFIVLIFNRSILMFGFTVATILVSSRTALIYITNLHLDLLTIFIQILPAGLFYIILAYLMDRLSIRSFLDKPLILFIFLVIFETIANVFEYLVLSIVLQEAFISLKFVFILLFVAIIRNSFILFILTSILFVENKKKLQQMTKLQANLYSEALYMKQTMQLTEQVTKDHFNLYQALQKENNPLSIEALRIVSELHEVKKNTQRVVGSLSTIASDDDHLSFTINEIIHMVVATQKKYASSLNKFITIDATTIIEGKSKNHLLLFSILNNIVSNAVEAIEVEGTITISTSETNNAVIFSISNNGPSIPLKDCSILFEAGYTTKFDSNGNSSTGIGLYHVKTLIESVGGNIDLISDEETIFTLSFQRETL